MVSIMQLCRGGLRLVLSAKSHLSSSIISLNFCPLRLPLCSDFLWKVKKKEGKKKKKNPLILGLYVYGLFICLGVVELADYCFLMGAGPYFLFLGL